MARAACHERRELDALAAASVLLYCNTLNVIMPFKASNLRRVGTRFAVPLCCSALQV